MTKRVHVVAAVIEDSKHNIFIAKRPLDKHQGGLWEFPGGKVEKNESAFEALKRELHEEIGIEVQSAHPLIQIAHDYPDKSVLLDTWKVTRFSGHAHGKENQQTQWVAKDLLDQYSFPAANRPIISAAQLPNQYAITPEPSDTDSFFSSLESVLEKGVELIQLRIKNAFSETLINKIVNLAKAYNAKIVLNTAEDPTQTFGTHGRHLSSKQLLSLEERPLSKNYLLAASCHNEKEIRHAEKIDADFIVLAPVLETSSHPGSPSLGWKKFQELSAKSSIPVYALGGMKTQMLEQAFQHGAQGIAGISTFFPRNNC